MDGTELRRHGAEERDALHRGRGERRTWSAIDARRRLNAARAGSARSANVQAGRDDARYAYLSDPHD